MSSFAAFTAGKAANCLAISATDNPAWTPSVACYASGSNLLLIVHADDFHFKGYITPGQWMVEVDHHLIVVK